tara:strand:- start:3521 stop:4714 length:1194 start_codon:yes stop_codon:yes gene_type:complete
MDGISFDGSSINGLARADESDLIAVPDTSTFALLPWRPSEQSVARVYADIMSTEGQPHQGDPRWILKNQIERARALGFTFYASAELEFFLLREEGGKYQPIDGAGYFDQDAAALGIEVRREIILTLEQMGIAVGSSHHEGAPGQQEIGLQHMDGLRMADAIQAARYVTREIARRHGLMASFMPRPVANVNGSGMHMGLSLYQDDKNAFYRDDAPLGLSSVARAFVAGILSHARESSAVLNQWVNSYRRLVPGTEAPTYISWAQTNRADMVRVPACREGREQSTRVEVRSPDSGCNPYLVLAVLLASGLDGIERKLEPPAPVTRNVFDMSAAERSEAGVESLPEDLGEAIHRASKGDFLETVLGPETWALFLENKRLEWADYRTHVSDWEIERYLGVL